MSGTREAAIRVALGLTIAAAVAALWLALSSTTYDAVSEVYVKSGPTDASTQMATGLFQQNRAQTYAALAHGTLVLEQAIASSSVDISPERLSQETSVQVLPQTVILEITVSDHDPATARTLSDAMATAIASQANRIEAIGSQGTDPVRLVVVERADLPTSATTPDRPRIITLAGLLGVLCALALPVPGWIRRWDGADQVVPAHVSLGP